LDAAFHHAERLTKIKDDEDLKHCQKFGKDWKSDRPSGFSTEEVLQLI
jgi:hypothetical protein